ncbi:hypothetical protein J6590_061841 [Homalodisca vitripennis]|nr:hypothetical protein J6590_061841 [Homalodisca vitripennis]
MAPRVVDYTIRSACSCQVFYDNYDGYGAINYSEAVAALFDAYDLLAGTKKRESGQPGTGRLGCEGVLKAIIRYQTVISTAAAATAAALA